MRILVLLLILLLQSIITFAALMVIYMIFVLMDYQGGIDNLVGVTIIQPIIGSLISILTIIICILIGLPLRVSSRINLWWTNRTWIPLSCLLCGLLLLLLSMFPFMSRSIDVVVESETIQRQIPNLAAAGAGWFLTAFSLLHVLPPASLLHSAEEAIVKYVGYGRR